jgi:hypothetical protein
MVDSIVAIATGEFTNTFSEVDLLPHIERKRPKIRRIPKYAQVAGRLNLYFISNRKISLNIIE